ncbi:hypothetical protein BC03BB108_B0079 (plasmid) [Bacillus cereus 03BB108]|nr:hypothetical protein BC03BB108_B0079 [Bacillus cereus 03BB108]
MSYSPFSGDGKKHPGTNLMNLRQQIYKKDKVPFYVILR